MSKANINSFHQESFLSAFLCQRLIPCKAPTQITACVCKYIQWIRRETINVDTASPPVPTPVLPGLYCFAVFLLCCAFFILFLFHLRDTNREYRLPGDDINLLVSYGIVPVKHIKRENIFTMTILWLAAKKRGKEAGKSAHCTTKHLLVGRPNSLMTFLLSSCCQMLFAFAVRTVCINNEKLLGSYLHKALFSCHCHRQHLWADERAPCAWVFVLGQCFYGHSHSGLDYSISRMKTSRPNILLIWVVWYHIFTMFAIMLTLPWRQAIRIVMRVESCRGCGKPSRQM